MMPMNKLTQVKLMVAEELQQACQQMTENGSLNYQV